MVPSISFVPTNEHPLCAMGSLMVANTNLIKGRNLYQRQSCLVARRAPSAIAWNLAHTTVG